MLNLRARSPAALATLLPAGLAHTGSHAALLTGPNGFGGTTLFQDSVGDGRVNAVYIDDVQLGLTVSAVPGPETDALLMAGLGLVATLARRRRN